MELFSTWEIPVFELEFMEGRHLHTQENWEVFVQ